jgi:hypothetical protein
MQRTTASCSPGGREEIMLTLQLHTRHTLFIPSYQYDYDRIWRQFATVKRIPAIAKGFSLATIFKACESLRLLRITSVEMTDYGFGSFDKSPMCFLGAIRRISRQSQVLPRDSLGSPKTVYFFLPLGLSISGTFFPGSHFANSFLTAAYFGSVARLVHSRASLS